MAALRARGLESGVYADAAADSFDVDPLAVDALAVDPLTADSFAADSFAVDPLAVDALVVDPLAADPLVADPLVADPLVPDLLAADPPAVAFARDAPAGPFPSCCLSLANIEFTVDGKRWALSISTAPPADPLLGA